MDREICLKQEYLKNEGYQDFKEWIETEGYGKIHMNLFLI
jgi:hypothetical protein